MPKCNLCGRSSLFLRLDGNGMCPNCSVAQRNTMTQRDTFIGRFIWEQDISSFHYDYDDVMRILSKYTSEEDEKDYCFRMGYTPLITGKIPMRELHERFQSLTYKKLYKVSAQKMAVRDSVRPETYFSNYDELLVNLSELSEFEKYFPFYSPTPTEMYRDYSTRSSDLISSFLKRWWDSVINNACNLKTVEGRQVRIQKEINNLMRYNSRFNDDNTTVLNKLTSTEINLETISKKEKQGPEFDAEAERGILSVLNQARSVSDKHFALISAADFYYKYRNTDRKYLDKCLELCFEDIEILNILNKEFIRRERLNKQQTVNLLGRLDDSRKEYYDRVEKYGFNGIIPAWKRICIIYENDGNIEQALLYCNMAIEYYTARGMNSEIEDFQKRKDKLEKKKVKRQNDQNHKSASDKIKITSQKRTPESESERIRTIVSSKYSGSTDKIEDNPEFVKIHLYASDNRKIGFVKIMKADMSLSFRKLIDMPQTFELSSIDDLKKYL